VKISKHLSSVLQNAEKSLGTLENKTLDNNPSITPHQSTIPKNAHMYVKTTLSYDEFHESWNFPPNVYG
jgi:hypothetical protein